MTLSHGHERWKSLLGRFVGILTEEMSMPMQSGGSTTFNREDVERGIALAKQFRDGTCQVNCHNSIAYGLPYGGQGISGGPGGGVNCEETFLDYTQVKAVYVSKYPG